MPDLSPESRAQMEKGWDLFRDGRWPGASAKGAIFNAGWTARDVEAEERQAAFEADLRIVFGLDEKAGFELDPNQIGQAARGHCRRCGCGSVCHWCPPARAARARVLAALAVSFTENEHGR